MSECPRCGLTNGFRHTADGVLYCDNCYWSEEGAEETGRGK